MQQALFPNFKKYSEYILVNHLDSLVNDTMNGAQKSNLVYYQLLSKYSHDEQYEIFKKGLEEQILRPVIENKPFGKIAQKIEAWKENSTVIPKDKLDIADITSIYSIRKDALIKYINYYSCTKEEMLCLITEIEKFFNTCIDLGLTAYDEIQKEELKSKNELLSGILSKIPLIVTKLNKEGKILFSAGAGLKSLGLHDQELSGQTVLDNSSHSKKTKDALLGNSSSFIGPSTSIDGEVREFENFYVPDKDGLISFSIDITKQREAEDRFENLVQGVKDYAIFMLNADGTVASWNEGAQNLKGYSKDEILGKHFSILSGR